jgi:hypothetical protein
MPRLLKVLVPVLAVTLGAASCGSVPGLPAQPQRPASAAPRTSIVSPTSPGPWLPLQPVSHGCVRIPMDIAQFFHTLVAVPGEPVYIRR